MSRVQTECEQGGPAGVRARGWSLPEVLVVTGLLAVLTGLALPTLGRSRAEARAVVSLSNIRVLGSLGSVYAASNDDRLPVIFEPQYGTIEMGNLQTITLEDGTRIPGGWFNNSTYAHLAFDPVPDPRVLTHPAAPRLRQALAGTPQRYLSDYKFADTHYTDFAYWDINTQQGPAQWRAQRLGAVIFPSSKGFMRQVTAYDFPDRPDGFGACCVDGIVSSVLWSDLSGEQLVQASLTPGVPNFWHHGLIGPKPVWSKGVPIDNTHRGTLGRDR